MIRRDDLDGPVADALIAHTDTATIHAVRPAADHYLVSLPQEIAERPLVRLVRAHLGTDDGDLWVVPADLAHKILDALVEGDDDALAELVDINKKKEW